MLNGRVTLHFWCSIQGHGDCETNNMLLVGNKL